MKKLIVAIMVMLASGVFACSDVDTDQLPYEAEEPTGNLFVEGCPTEGMSTAKQITNPDMGVQGPDALADQGDYLLMNSKSAFVITSPDNADNTYHYYGGIPVDGVAIDDCKQVTPERFEEMSFIVGKKVSPLVNSTIRTFRGDDVRIINDGSDGQAAIVRVEGADHYMWLVELELIAMLKEMGGTKPLSSPIGLDIYVDYILPPDSQVLQVDVNIHNTTGQLQEILSGVMFLFGDTTTLKYPYASKDDTLKAVFGLVPVGVPWMAASGGDGAWTFSMKDSDLGVVSLSGVSVAMDPSLLLDTPLQISAGSTETLTYYFGVGKGDYSSGIEEMYDYVPTLNVLPGSAVPYEQVSLEGRTFDTISGEPLAGVDVEVQVQNKEDEWVFLTGFITDKKGEFSGAIPDMGVLYRLVCSLDGWPDPDPVYFLPSKTSRLEVGFSKPGILLYDVRDYRGINIPAKILLWQGGDIVKRIYTTSGRGQEELPRGEYSVTITRGVEYAAYQGTVDLYPGLITPLQVNLLRAVDTTGYMSADTHMHSGPSPDNYILASNRVATMLAEGLEVAVTTEHEYVWSWQPLIDSMGLNQWGASIIGQEVTAPLPGHTNMYGGLDLQFDVNARGGLVKWWESQEHPGYSMGLAEIFQAERDRGAEVVQINHPRSTGATYFLEYDYQTGDINVSPQSIGLPAGTDMWSWDFDAFEIMNGCDPVFKDGTDPKTGQFEDWQSFLNLGHRVTAVGVSDVHNYGTPAWPRIFYESSTDEPSEFSEPEFVQAVKDGRALVSCGAFARVAVVDAQGESLGTMGDEVQDADGNINLWVHIESIPQIDVTHFKIFVNCDKVDEINTQIPVGAIVKHDQIIPLSLTGDAHITVLGFGKFNLPKGMPQFDSTEGGGVPRFVTNAIYVDVGADGYNPPGAKTCSAP